jgi:hypothetical protein
MSTTDQTRIRDLYAADRERSWATSTCGPRATFPTGTRF